MQVTGRDVQIVTGRSLNRLGRRAGVLRTVLERLGASEYVTVGASRRFRAVRRQRREPPAGSGS